MSDLVGKGCRPLLPEERYPEVPREARACDWIVAGAEKAKRAGAHYEKNGPG